MTFRDDRYDQMKYERCGRSGIRLPRFSLGCWHNWGHGDDLEEARRMMHRAFDLGITVFDFANNYGPPHGSAEINGGRILREDFAAYRDELIITSKAGYLMWPGPYGEFGSRKYLLASLDQSLKRLGVEYVDIFYSHRHDPDTPLEETMGALDHAVRSGKALYAGISNYPPDATREAYRILRELGTPLLLTQVPYSMIIRTIEEGLLDAAEDLQIGVTTFCPLAQGLLTDKYIDGIPAQSRAARAGSGLPKERITPEVQKKLRALQEIAKERGTSVARVAFLWVLRDRRITSVLTGASRVSQIEDAVAALDDEPLTKAEIERIDGIFPRTA